MRTTLAILALAAACSGSSSPRVLLLQPAGAPPEIRAACALAELRCSSCHTLERITNAVHRTPPEWEWQVRRMRLMPASGISQADADTIVTCLVWRDPDRAQVADAGPDAVALDAFLVPPPDAPAPPPVDAGAPPD
ncbi:MAG: photosystem P840 reaction-center cytochrome c-551 [Myxococcales bacterium]|nr:photosystem P840 reaction-center cytochrome c-551 [Myxococcales bacterium]